MAKPTGAESGAHEVVPTLTEHSRVRVQQRGITARMMQIAPEYGECYPSHRATCFRLTERALHGTPFVSKSDRLRGLCVVAQGASIVTVKWDFRIRRPGPLRRANWDNWRALRRGCERCPKIVHSDEVKCLRMAA